MQTRFHDRTARSPSALLPPLTRDSVRRSPSSPDQRVCERNDRVDRDPGAARLFTPMSELNDLYQEVILDHTRHPHNFRAMADASRKAEGYNPLCGDQVTVYLKLNGARIEDISVAGKGRAISN